MTTEIVTRRAGLGDLDALLGDVAAGSELLADRSTCDVRGDP
jgi:hypothetical protein